MFERWTERARQVVTLSQEEARTMGHTYIGTEHLLLGLLREREGLAARVLEGLGVDEDATRQAVLRICGTDGKSITEQIPFTPRAKKAMEMALREALSLGHNYIGTEHVLLGLVRDGEGVAARILNDLDLDGEAVRREVIRFLTEGKSKRTPTKPMYTVAGLKCDNCKWRQDNADPQPIPLGQLVADTRCARCGCKTLLAPLLA